MQDHPDLAILPQKYITHMEATTTTMDRQEFFRLVGTSIGAIMLTRCLSGCTKENGTDPTPSGSIDFTISLNDNVFANLNQKGGYAYKNGVIIARTQADQIIAVSSACTHEGTQVIFQSNNNRFYCPSHGSAFDTEGKVLNSPASRALTKYNVSSDKTTGSVRIYS